MTERDGRMSESATTLETIADSGAFESLATAVLRRAHRHCKSIIHTGVNAVGKPVRSAVDGVAVVPGAFPLHFIMLQHTTIARPALRGKWMDENGDIAKAVAIISRERKRTPDARLTLVLTSNRIPDESLVRDAHVRAKAANIELDIWDQSRLVDFLDHDPDGQWLRKIYLGIDQQRLSKDLLTNLSERSARALREIVLDDTEAWVERSLDRELSNRVQGNDGLTFLIMPSGTGKTTAVAKLLSRWVESDRFGLWIPPQAIENAITLEQAVDTVLRSFEPALERNSGAAARNLSTVESPLLLVIDDINRSARAAALAERVSAWTARPRDGKDGKTPSMVGAHVICPVWPQTIEQVSEPARRLVTSHGIVDGAFSHAEAVKAVLRRASVDRHSLSEMKAAEISDSLGNDPLLIALASTEVQTGRLPDAVIPSFIANQVQACAATTSEGFIAADYHRALDTLAWEMLTHRNLAPSWDHVAAWLPSESLAPLRNLLQQRTLCHMEGRATQERVIFRHDRVRNAVLAKALNRRMTTDQAPDDVIADPFYSEVLGLALTGDALPSEWIERVASQNPLALFHALRTLQESPTNFETKIVDTIVSWLHHHHADRGSQRLRWAMQTILANLDAPVVLHVAKHFHENSHILHQACFRNGDVRCGAAFCYSLDPGTNAPFRDSLVNHTIKNFGSILIGDLSSLLVDPLLSPELRIGALYLAGYVADPALHDAIAHSWKHFDRTPDSLPAFIWASCHCVSALSEQILDPVFDYWASLPERDDKTPNEPHRFIVDDHGIQFGFARNPPSRAMKYLIKQALRPELRWPITVLLECVDDPEAVIFIAQERARIARELEGTDRFSPWLSRGGMRERQPLGTPSRTALRQLWEDETADRHLRNRAFELWAPDATGNELPLVRRIGSTSVLFDRALPLRVKLGDLTAIPAFRDKIRTTQHRSYWWQFAREFWCAEFTEQLEEELTQRSRECSPTWEKSNYETDRIVSELIMKLDSETAERLLVTHWSHLQYDPDFIQAALFVATEKCRALVKDALDRAPDPRELLKHLDHRWYIGGTQHYGRLTAARLSAIEPYLDLLEEIPIGSLWTACNVDEFYEWRRANLDHRIPDKWRRREGTTDADLIAGLDETAQKDTHHWAFYWLERFEERGDPPERALAIVRQWLANNTTIKAYEIAAECVMLRGRRSDLNILISPELPSGEEVDAIYRNTRFAVFNRTLI